MALEAAGFDLITRVGPGTPMGEMLRRYWVPAMLADELPNPDGQPKALRLLGEDLVAFRDTSGRVGIMDIHCPHRLSSLALGRNEEGGLRCLYHGWKIDVDGRILETPCELPTSRLKDHLVHRAYPVREAADLIWVFMGPRDQIPALPDFNWMRIPAERRAVGKMWEKCNFIQGMEGIFDTYHTNLLHSGFEVLHWTPEQIAEVWKRPSRATHGVIFYEDTSYGYHYGAVREPTHDADRLDYVRITEYVAPYYCINPPDLGSKSAGFFFVPIDDENTMLYQVSAAESDERTIDRDQARRQMSMMLGEDLDEDFRPRRNETNNFGQNRELMLAGVRPESTDELRRVRNAYTGIDTGVQTQDMAMVETMGAISDRTREHLGASDAGIIHWRESLVRAVKGFAAGETPRGLDPPAPYHQIAGVGALVDKGADWRSVLWSAQQEPVAVSDDSSVIATAAR
jgi:phthalate 4,5-dioxygenase oxygenase subunit